MVFIEMKEIFVDILRDTNRLVHFALNEWLEVVVLAD